MWAIDDWLNISNFIKMKGYRRSNLGHRSRRGRLTAAPAGDGGGATYRAAVPQPLLWWGSPRATASLSRRGLALRGRCGMANTPKGILGGCGDQSSARDGVPFFSISATVRASSSGAPARPRPPAASPWSPQTPPRLQLWWTATEIDARQWRLGQRRWLSLGPKYARYRALFIGVFG
jgi:hypothetical protein